MFPVLTLLEKKSHSYTAVPFSGDSTDLSIYCSLCDLLSLWKFLPNGSASILRFAYSESGYIVLRDLFRFLYGGQYSKKRKIARLFMSMAFPPAKGQKLFRYLYRAEVTGHKLQVAIWSLAVCCQLGPSLCANQNPDLHQLNTSYCYSPCSCCCPSFFHFVSEADAHRGS